MASRLHFTSATSIHGTRSRKWSYMTPTAAIVMTTLTKGPATIEDLGAELFGIYEDDIRKRVISYVCATKRLGYDIKFINGKYVLKGN